MTAENNSEQTRQNQPRELSFEEALALLPRRDGYRPELRDIAKKADAFRIYLYDNGVIRVHEERSGPTSGDRQKGLFLLYDPAQE